MHVMTDAGFQPLRQNRLQEARRGAVLEALGRLRGSAGERAILAHSRYRIFQLLQFSMH